MGDAVGNHFEETGLAHEARSALDVEVLIEDVVEAPVLVLGVNLLLSHGNQNRDALENLRVASGEGLEVVLDVLRTNKRVHDVEFHANLVHVLANLIKVNVIAIVGDARPEL